MLHRGNPDVLSVAEHRMSVAKEEHVKPSLMCFRCMQFLPTDMFYKDQYTKRGYKNTCKKCISDRRRERLKEDQDYQEHGGDYLKSPEVKDSSQKNGEFTKSKDRKTESGSKEQTVISDDNLPGESSQYESEAPVKGESVRSATHKRALATLMNMDIPLCNFPELWERDNNYSCCFVAPRRSGKTTMIKYLFPYWRSIFDKVIFCTKSRQADIYDFLPKEDQDFVITYWDDRFMNYLEYLQRKTDNAFRFLIIFDDLLDKHGMRNSKAMNDMFTRGRNMKCSIIVSTQSVSYLNPDVRKNIDILMLMGVHNQEDSDVIYERLCAGIVPMEKGLPVSIRKDLFFEWIQEKTEDFWTLIISFMKENKKQPIFKLKAPE